MVETTNKVVPETEDTDVSEETTEDETTEKEKGNRIDFPIADALYRDKDGNIVSAVNADGLLIAVPKPIKDADGKIVYAGFDSRKHNTLKKTAFAGIAIHLRYQALMARVRAIILIKGAEEKERKAANVEKFGDEATRKRVQKVARMREQLAALTQQLKDDNVDISEI